MELHEKIRVMREMNQWSQEEMAEKLAMSANGYAKIERGQTKLTFDKLNQIAQIFKIDVVELITKEKPLFLLVGDNSHNYGSNYYGNNEALIALLTHDRKRNVLVYRRIFCFRSCRPCALGECQRIWYAGGRHAAIGI